MSKYVPTLPNFRLWNKFVNDFLMELLFWEVLNSIIEQECARYPSRGLMSYPSIEKFCTNISYQTTLKNELINIISVLLLLMIFFS